MLKVVDVIIVCDKELRLRMVSLSFRKDLLEALKFKKYSFGHFMLLHICVY